MFAIVGVFNMDAARHEEQKRELHERIIPMCRQLPGFVSGYWSYDPETFRHSSHLVFRERETAEGLVAMIAGDAERQKAHGVTPVSVDIVEVLGSA